MTIILSARGEPSILALILFKLEMEFQPNDW